MRILTNSALKSFRRCPREYYYNYVEMIDVPFPGYTQNSFMKGNMIHAAVTERHLGSEVVLKDYPAIHILMSCYDPSDIIIVKSELQLHYANEESGIILAGKLDAIVTREGEQFIMETKSSRYRQAEKEYEDYWVKWEIDRQISMYSLLARRNNIEHSGIIINFIRYPTLKRTKLETMEHFCERVNDNINERPDTYFARIVAERSEEDDLSTEIETTQEINLIKLCERNNIWPRTGEACNEYRDLCRFQGLCRGVTTLDQCPKREKLHRELDESLYPGIKPIF